MYSIYLRFEGQEKAALETFRHQYDSLATSIEAHITVAFPFEATTSQIHSIIGAIETLSSNNGLDITLSNDITYTASVGFLKVLGGHDDIVHVYEELAEKLNAVSQCSFTPHVTVVRGCKVKPLALGLRTNSFRVTGIVLECIGQNDECIVEHEKNWHEKNTVSITSDIANGMPRHARDCQTHTRL